MARARRAPRVYDHAREPVFVVQAYRRSAHPERPRHDTLAHELARWLAVGALALVTVVFLLIILQ